MDINYIVTPIIGAGIGYFTNYVAIKMLFKPYTEKRLLGIKLPFTPGLIPKERENIARKIGDVTQNYLLTDEVIVNELSSKAMEEIVISFIEKAVFDEAGYINVDKIFFFLQVDDGWIKNGLAKKIAEGIINVSNNEDTRAQVVGGITKQMVRFLSDYKIKDMEAGQELLNKELQGALGGQPVNQMIIKQLQTIISEDKSLKELLPDSATSVINNAINFNTPAIIDGLKGILRHEKVEEKLTEMINDTIQAKLGALGAMFANPDDIYAMVVEKAEEKLDIRENQELIIDGIIRKAYDMLDKELYELIPQHMQEEIISQLASNIQDRVAGIEILSLLTDNIQDKSLYESLDAILKEEAESKIYSLIEKLYDQFINHEKAEELFIKGTSKVFDKLVDVRIKVSDDSKEKMRTIVIDQYQKLVVPGAKQFSNDIPLARMVEDQLNSFDMAMLEDLILQIARKELRAITWFGALLGFVMGSLSVILQNI